MASPDDGNPDASIRATERSISYRRAFSVKLFIAPIVLSLCALVSFKLGLPKLGALLVYVSGFFVLVGFVLQSRRIAESVGALWDARRGKREKAVKP